MLTATIFILECLTAEALLATVRMLCSIACGVALGIAGFAFLLRSGKLWNLSFRPHAGHVLLDLAAACAILAAVVNWTSVSFAASLAAESAAFANTGSQVGESTCRSYRMAASLAGAASDVDCTAAIRPARAAALSTADRIRRYFDGMLWPARLWIVLPTFLITALAFLWTSSAAYRSLHF